MNDLILEYFFEVVSQTTLIDGVIYAPLGLTISHCCSLIVSFGMLIGAAAYVGYQLISLLVTLIRLLFAYLKARNKNADPSKS